MTKTTDKAPEGDKPTTISDLTPAQEKTVEKDALVEAATEIRKEAIKAASDTGQTPGDPPHGRKLPSPPYEVSRIEHFVDYPLAQLKDEIDPDKKGPLTEVQIAGLLEVEKSGKNRTDVVELLEDRLGVKAEEVTGAGPAYTNDVTRNDPEGEDKNPLDGAEYVNP